MAKNEKSFWVKLAICVGLMTMIWGGYLLCSRKLALIVDTTTEDDYLWVAQIDSVDMKNDEIIMKGFAFEMNKDAEKGAYCIVLRDLDSGEYLFPKMKYTERKDVNCYFQGECNYFMSGFEATIKEKKVDLNGSYEILIKSMKDKTAYRIDTYLVGNEIAYVNPNEYVAPEVTEELRSVVTQGQVRGWCPEVGFYVYQCGDELICLMNKDYKLQKEYSNRLVVCVGTTQKDRLPAYRVDMGASIDEIEVYFDDTKLFGDFYMQKIELPEEYAIAEIEIGNYLTDHWVWHECFKPIYVFE